MKKNSETKEHTHIHFIGIGGCGVSALAQIAHSLDYVVTGSDLNESIYTNKLIDLGIEVAIGKHKKDNVKEGVSLVVRSSAVKETNVEVLAAKKRNIPTIKHAEFLGILMEDRYGICVAGSHGKTTTDALIGLILKEAGLDPTMEVGGYVHDIESNALVGDNRYFVAEACEFDHSFLNLKPDIAIILNIEIDHPDYYPDMSSLKKAFVDFLNLVPDDGYIIANDESPEVREVLSRTKSKANVITFGFHEKAEIKIEQERVLENSIQQFRLTGMEKREKSILNKINKGMAVFETNLPGKHNILNAVASLIVSDLLGADLQAARKILMEFKGLGRRFEELDRRFGMRVITDYAHHPSQIKATIKSAKQADCKRIIVAFQPHTFTRTKALFEDFTKCFQDGDQVFILDTYIPEGRREKPLPGFTSKDLTKHIQKIQDNVKYVGDLEKAKEEISNFLEVDDCLLLLGAGNIYTIGKNILREK